MHRRLHDSRPLYRPPDPMILWSSALDLHPSLRHRRKICLKDERAVFLHKLQPLLPYSEEMKELLHNTSTQSRHFLHNMRTYNSSVSFASMGAMMHHHQVMVHIASASMDRSTTICSHCIPNQERLPSMDSSIY